MNGMETARRAPTKTVRRETAAARRLRVEGEAELIAKARASAAAGRTVSEAHVDAWIDSIGTNRELPPPRSRS
jgi:hypothetical protein